jgi:hypothetical protein
LVYPFKIPFSLCEKNLNECLLDIAGLLDANICYELAIKRDVVRSIKGFELVSFLILLVYPFEFLVVCDKTQYMKILVYLLDAN